MLWRNSTRRALALLPVVAVATLLSAVPPASATALPGLPYANWAKTGGGEATEVRVISNIAVEPNPQPWQRPANVFCAHNFGPANSGSGGYMGFQKRGWAPAKVAIFSWWNALDAACSGANVVACKPFDGEGVGYQTLVSFDWQPNTDYTFRLWRGDRDAGRDADWWSAEVLNAAGARLTAIGSILIPTAWGGIAGLGQWTEWFGMADRCDQIPLAEVWYGPPRMDGVPATPSSTGVGYDVPCPASATWANGGSRQRIGTLTSSQPLTVQNARAVSWHPSRLTLDGSAAWLVVANEVKAASGQVAPAYLFAHRFGFIAGGEAAGLVGLTITPAGKHAVFSITGADGTAQDAVVPFDWKPGRFYYPFVYQLSPGVFGGWIFDHSAATWVPIGALNVPSGWGLLSNFTSTTVDWIGPGASSCLAIPRAEVLFNRATGVYAGQWYDAVFGGHVTGDGDCPAPGLSTVHGTWTLFQFGATIS